MALVLTNLDNTLKEHYSKTNKRRVMGTTTKVYYFEEGVARVDRMLFDSMNRLVGRPAQVFIVENIVMNSNNLIEFNEINLCLK